MYSPVNCKVCEVVIGCSQFQVPFFLSVIVFHTFLLNTGVVLDFFVYE